MDDVIKKIFTVNLGVKKDETVIVFTDVAGPEKEPPGNERPKGEELREIAKAVARAGSTVCNTVYLEYPALGQHGVEPPVAIWEAAFGKAAVDKLIEAKLLGKILSKKAGADEIKAAGEIIKTVGSAPDAVIALAHYSTSHTRFRSFLTRKGARYASMPLFDREMLGTAMTADWKEVERRTMRLVKKMTGGDTVYITSHNGTSISFSIKGREVQPDTGIITAPGSFSNLPAGEAFLAPVEGTAEGTLVLEWAPTRRLAYPVELYVKDGNVVDISGRDPFADELRGIIEREPLSANVAELGIGTNDKAKRPDNILETEKILGTVHVAIGDNSSFGGRVSVPFHEDFIFFRPTMEVIKGEDKTEILIDGEPRW
ncbi:MAG: aminopeptidase [Deltaproteobacteria bacterium]|nr:aminopeptidase [Deltaproteobacteria bacterium]